jgi:hypothetical protein
MQFALLRRSRSDDAEREARILVTRQPTSMQA